MRRYETIFILRPDLTEAQIKESIRRFEGIIANGGGEMIETDEWGSRELAYNIGRERRGYYVRLDYAATGAVTNEVERNLKIADNVLRYLSVMVSPEADAAKLRGEIESRKQRMAEARMTPVESEAVRTTAEPEKSEIAPAEEPEQTEPEGGTQSN